MVEKISKHQAYINAVMAKLPDVKEKKAYKIKKGETLWSVAKRNLNKKKATHNEINNRMLLIAKMNNLKTVEKMNNLKVNQSIYLPSAGVQPTTNKNIKKTVVSKVQNNSVQKQTKVVNVRTNAEKSSLNVLNSLKNDKTVKVEKVHIYGDTNCYHITNSEKTKYGFINQNNMLTSFNTNGNKINDIYVEDSKKNLNPFGYDYKIDKNGMIKENQYPFKVKGKLSKQENVQLRTELKKAMQKVK